jgi:ABC-2 type transport system ATP-binding protein
VSEPVVDVRGLHVRFGEVEAVAGIDVQAYAGQATALLGRNGAGKSTTMRVLAGVVPPTEGTVTVAGHDIRSEALTVSSSPATAPTWAAWCRAPRPGSTSSSAPACVG